MKSIFVLMSLAICGSAYGRFDTAGLSPGIRFHYNSYDYGGLISKRLLNGRKIAITDAPYMAIVQADKSFQQIWPFGTAVIITSHFLLSTAEFFKVQNGKYMKAYLGISDINQIRSENIYDVENVIIKDNYNFKIYDDIAVIKLSREIKFNNYQKPIHLHTSNDADLFGKKKLTILGYGYNKVDGKENSLGILTSKTEKIKIKETTLSQEYFSVLIDPQMCPGDHGSPLVIENQLIGLASFTNGCNQDDSRNTKIFVVGIKHQYKWICDMVGEENFNIATNDLNSKI